MRLGVLAELYSHHDHQIQVRRGEVANSHRWAGLMVHSAPMRRYAVGACGRRTEKIKIYKEVGR